MNTELWLTYYISDSYDLYPHYLGVNKEKALKILQEYIDYRNQDLEEYEEKECIEHYKDETHYWASESNYFCTRIASAMDFEIDL
jgi:hypothetical protein